MGAIKQGVKKDQCPNKCNWQGPISSVKGHLKQCPQRVKEDLIVPAKVDSSSNPITPPREEPSSGRVVPPGLEIPPDLLEQLKYLQSTVNAFSSRLDEVKSTSQFDTNALKREVIQFQGQRDSMQEEMRRIQEQIQHLIQLHTAEREQTISQLNEMKAEMERVREEGIQSGGSAKWIIKKPLSMGRCFTSSISHSGKIFAFGGSSHDVIHSILECYDPKTNTWTTMQPMPSARCGYALVVVGDYILCLGGIEMLNEKQQLSSKVEAYNVPNNQWMRATNMLTPRAYFSAVFAGNRVFCFGGLGTSNLNVFDPAGNAWEQTVIPLPSERFILSAIEHGGLIYLLGGSAEGGREKIDVEIFNPSTRKFFEHEKFEMDNINSQGAVLVGNKVVCIGGIGSDGNYTSKVRILDLGSKTWTDGPNLPSPRSGFGVAACNGIVYCIGGRSVGDDHNPRDLDDNLSLVIEAPQ